MNDVQKFNLSQARKWLSGEVEIRMPKAWLVGGGLVLLVLLIIALD
jgi:hypothetical protein